MPARLKSKQREGAFNVEMRSHLSKQRSSEKARFLPLLS